MTVLLSKNACLRVSEEQLRTKSMKKFCGKAFLFFFSSVKHSQNKNALTGHFLNKWNSFFFFALGFFQPMLRRESVFCRALCKFTLERRKTIVRWSSENLKITTLWPLEREPRRWCVGLEGNKKSKSFRPYLSALTAVRLRLYVCSCGALNMGCEHARISAVPERPTM